ncbi:MAG: TonB-dependent receptor [Woeseiaceae bacterium]|nr:TonB-dependent receptor [Woeseiaceae bacterium]
MSNLIREMAKVARFAVGLGALLTASLALVSPAAAQQSVTEGEAVIFEEIVVLATRRAQNIMDVPVAVSTLTGTQIEEAGIKDVWDLQQNVPGLIVGQSQTATSSNFSIRSIGSTSNNFGVESAVGLYVDGVYRSRQSSVINELVDVEAVEVLRGPQGTLFGKNTVAGAMLFRTVRPTQNRDAFVDLTVGDLGLVKVSAATNIPINDEWAFRGTVFSSQRDGYVDDYNLGDDLYNDRDRIGGRLQLAKGEPGDDFTMRVIADYSEIDETCCVGIFRIDSIYYRGSLANPATITPGSDAAALALGGTVFTDFPYPQVLLDALTAPPPAGQGFPGTIVTGTGFDDYVTAQNSPPISQNEDSGLSLELEWVLANDMTLKSISALRNFDTYDFIDGDFSDTDVFIRENDVELTAFSQELQLTGEFGTGNTFVGGLYYFGQEIDQETLTAGRPFFGPLVDILRPALPQTVAAIEQLRAGLVGSPLEGFIAPATVAFPTGVSAFDVTKQDQDGWAVFGQVDFALSDKFTLTLGARYTDETKDIDATYTQTANGPPPDLRSCAPEAGNPFGPIGDYTGGDICIALTEASIYFSEQIPDGMGGMMDNPCYQGQAGEPCADLDALLAGALVPVTQPNVAWGSYLFDPLAPRPDVRESLSDDQTTGTAKLTFFPNDNVMLYLSYGTGFKSGGTNTDRINPSFDQVFSAETSESIELGIKGEAGPVQYVVTLYQTDFEDFQANSFTGTGFNLQNAGDLSIDGVEIELLWRPTDSTEIQAFYTHNEGEYDSFENGTAWDTWVFHEGAWIGQGDPGCSAPLPADLNSRPESCPRTGDPLPYNPEDRAFLAVTQNFNLTNSTSMFIRGEWSYWSEQFTDGDLDPFTLQDDVNIVNLRLGFNFDSIDSTLTFWGRNITDERYYHGSADVPVTFDKMFSYPSEPATYGVTFNKRFD